MDKLIQEFHTHLEENYNTYKKEMLENTPEEIYNTAGKIHFIECINDYLNQYEWDNNTEHWLRLNVLNDYVDIFESLWQVYIDVEWVGYSSFEEIDDLMGVFYERNKIK